MSITDIPPEEVARLGPIRVQHHAQQDHSYLSVVQDVYTGDRPEMSRTVRTLGSFGRETPESRMRAERCKAMAEAICRLLKETTLGAEHRVAFLAVFGETLGGAVVDWYIKVMEEQT